MTTYVVIVAIHVLAAAVWIGSLAFFALVVVPALRRVETGERRAALLRAIGHRFRIVGWACLAVLVVTGVLNLRFRGIGADLLFDANFWATSFGKTLAAKLGLVAVLLGATAAHDVLAASPRRRLVSWLGRATLLLSIGILVLAVALVRGVDP
jgi:putative copper export protein